MWIWVLAIPLSAFLAFPNGWCICWRGKHPAYAQWDDYSLFCICRACQLLSAGFFDGIILTGYCLHLFFISSSAVFIWSFVYLLLCVLRRKVVAKSLTETPPLLCQTGPCDMTILSCRTGLTAALPPACHCSLCKKNSSMPSPLLRRTVSSTG